MCILVMSVCLCVLQRVCDEWKDACKILLSDVKGSPVDLRVTSNLVPTSATDILPTPSVSVESNVRIRSALSLLPGP